MAAYVIDINEYSVDFIAEFFNNGVAPAISSEPTYFYAPIGDTEEVPRILTADEWIDIGSAAPEIIGINIQKI